jgi:hypothetical protein
MHEILCHPLYRLFRPSPFLVSQHQQNSYLPLLSSLLVSLVSGQMHETLCPPFYRQNSLHHTSPANTSRKTTCLYCLLVSLLSGQMHQEMHETLTIPRQPTQAEQIPAFPLLSLSLTSLWSGARDSLSSILSREQTSPSPASQHKHKNNLPLLSLSLTSLQSDARDSLSSIYRQTIPHHHLLGNTSTLDRKSDLFISRTETARPCSKFLHSCGSVWICRQTDPVNI